MSDARHTRQLTASEKVHLVGHELRNRLGVVSNSVYYLTLRLQDADDKMARHLCLLAQEVTASSQIVCNLMDWVATKEPIKESLHLNRLVEQLCTQNPPPAGVHVATSLAESLPPCSADVAQLSRALANLLLWEYNLLSQGGELVISTRCEGAQVCFCLHDSEPPFTHDLATTLLDIHSDEHLTPSQLGLLVAHDLLLANGCQLDVAKPDEDAWRFCVRIPCSPGEGYPQ